MRLRACLFGYCVRLSGCYAMCYLLALAKRRYDNRRFRHKTPLLLNAEELEGESHIA